MQSSAAASVTLDPKSWKPGRWALLTVILYAATLCALTAPLLVVSFYKKDALDFKDAEEVYRPENWPYWLTIGVLSLLEGIALFFPVAVSRQRPVRRRSWMTLALTTGLMFGVLVAGLSLSIQEVFGGKDFTDDSKLIPAGWWALGLGMTGWVFWGLFFFFTARQSDERSFLRRIRNYLIAGSIIELLVAVPSHIYARNKDDCCAGIATFVGIATGLCVMLFAFGPGVFLLFAERVAALRRAQDESGHPPSGVFESHGRDTATWTALATGFLFVPDLAAVVARVAPPEQLLMIARISFIVLGVAACLSASRAWQARERLWGVSVLFGVYLLEAMILILHAWFHP